MIILVCAPARRIRCLSFSFSLLLWCCHYAMLSAIIACQPCRHCWYDSNYYAFHFIIIDIISCFSSLFSLLILIYFITPAISLFHFRHYFISPFSSPLLFASYWFSPFRLRHFMPLLLLSLFHLPLAIIDYYFLRLAIFFHYFRHYFRYFIFAFHYYYAWLFLYKDAMPAPYDAIL